MRFSYLLFLVFYAGLLFGRSAEYPFQLLPQYDDLSTFDPLYYDYETKFFRRARKSMTANIGFNYSWTSQWYDKEGTKIDSSFVYGMNRERGRFGTADYSSYNFYADLSYCPTSAWKIGIITPVVYKTIVPQDANNLSSFSIGDIWLYGNALMMPDPSVILRLGIKAPTGTWQDYYRPRDWNNEREIDRDANPPTGDGQWDFDLGVLSSIPIQRHKSGVDPLVLEIAAGLRLRARKTFSDYVWSNSWTDTLEAYSGGDSIVNYKVEERLKDLRPGNEFHFSVGPKALLTPKIWGAVKLTGFFGFNTRINGERMTYENGRLVEEESFKNIDMDGRKVIYINPSIDFEMGVGLSLKANFKYPLLSGANHPVDNQIIGVVMSRKFGPAPYPVKKWK